MGQRDCPYVLGVSLSPYPAPRPRRSERLPSTPADAEDHASRDSPPAPVPSEPLVTMATSKLPTVPGEEETTILMAKEELEALRTAFESGDLPQAASRLRELLASSESIRLEVGVTGESGAEGEGLPVSGHLLMPGSVHQLNPRTLPRTRRVSSRPSQAALAP